MAVVLPMPRCPRMMHRLVAQVVGGQEGASVRPVEKGQLRLAEPVKILHQKPL